MGKLKNRMMEQNGFKLKNIILYFLCISIISVCGALYIYKTVLSHRVPPQAARSEAFVTNCDDCYISIDSVPRMSDTIRVHIEGKFDADYITIDSAIKLFGEIIPVRSIIRADSRPKVTMYIYGGPAQQNGAGAPKQNISQPQKDY